MGDPGKAQAVLFLGLHAASGTDGFLPHTMTSRLAAVRVNGAPLSEVSLFAALLAPYGIRPVFFSGCPAACRQAAAAIPGIFTYSIDKQKGPEGFDVLAWRYGLAQGAVASLANHDARPLAEKGPFKVEVFFRDGDAAALKVARRWRLEQCGDGVRFEIRDLPALFLTLSRICYLRPAWLPLLPLALPLYRLMGRAGLHWARHRLKRLAAPSF
jgi:D-aminopeptidase